MGRCSWLGPASLGRRKDPDGAVAVLRAAVAAGVDHIDTSDFYGPPRTNEIIRKALQPYQPGLAIVTKVGAVRPADGSWQRATSAQDLTAAVHDNLWYGQRPPVSRLRGRVVVVDVFTFECSNCTNVTPNLKRMYARYSRADLEIIAVHAPEVPSYQSRLAYVAREAQAAALPRPIAIDNGAHIWNAYGVSAWPTQLLFDRRGRLAATIIGDGQDARVESAVRSLVRPA
jgi:thiol-disulfide isomerase/thioredoxin